MSKNSEEQIITEYVEQGELDLVVDDTSEEANENVNEETKEFSDSGASVRVTVTESKPFGDQPYASGHL